jgi:hypothetical protein
VEHLEDQLSAMNSPVSTTPSLLPSWIKGGCSATLFLADMPKHIMVHYSSPLILIVGIFILGKQRIKMAFS